MYPIPPTETLVQTKTCRHCSALFPITDKDLEFYEKVSPVFPLQPSPPTPLPEGEGRKVEWDKIRYLIPTPTLCPDCRQQRRLSFRNERKLYKRKCDATGKDIVSMYSPDKSFTVYHQDYWWSDKWDPMDYWRDFDFNRGFFEQFQDLRKDIPQAAKSVFENENSEYCNQSGNSKNCYLVFSNTTDEDCYYGNNVNFSKNSVDSTFINTCEECYSCLDCSRCMNVHYSQNCIDSSYCLFVIDARNTHHCCLSYNVHNKSYVFENKELTPEEYGLRLNHFLWLPVKEKAKRIQQWKESAKHEAVFHYNMCMGTEESFGSRLEFAKNTSNSFDCSNTEYVKYCYFISNAKSCYDVSEYAESSSFICECIGSGINLSFSAFVTDCVDSCYHTFYSDMLTACKDCFWCIGLRNKSYCILNKQYTKEEYEVLVPKIIEHMMKPLPRPPVPMGVSGTPSNEGECEWWEFFPSSLSPFGYNETVAQEYYPLTREEVLSALSSEGEGSGVRFNWSDYEAPFPRVEKIIPADKLPDDVSKISDDILNWAIECEVTKKPFRIIKQELEFYRKHHLPIPRRHPDQRHLDRMALRNPRKLFERKCDKCGVEMVTTYSPERKEIVYCESCYNAEVIG